MKDFNLFKMFTPKPIEKDDEYNIAPTNLKGFFVMLGRKFWNISNLNLVIVFCNLPIFFAFAGPLKWLTWLLVITLPLSCIGSAYVTRSFNRAEPSFLYSDFFGAIKKNFPQGLIVGILDVLLCAVLIIDLSFWASGTSFIDLVFWFASLFLLVVYFFMRFYIYTILITFDLSTFKIFKNSFIFVFLGLKRNLMALLGIAAVWGVMGFLYMYILPVAIGLCIVLTFALTNFITGYASYPVIKKYMIDPYYGDESHDDESDDINSDDEPVFEDRG